MTCPTEGWRAASYQTARQWLLTKTYRQSGAAGELQVWRAPARARIRFPDRWRGPKAFVGEHLYLFGGVDRRNNAATTRVDLATGLSTTAAPPPKQCRLVDASAVVTVVAARWVWIFGRYDQATGRTTFVYDTRTDTWRELLLQAPVYSWRVLTLGYRIYILANPRGDPLECNVLDVHDFLFSPPGEVEGSSSRASGEPTGSCTSGDSIARDQTADSVTVTTFRKTTLERLEWRNVAAPPFTDASNVWVMSNGSVRVESLTTLVTWVDYWPPVLHKDVWRVASSGPEDAIVASATESAASATEPAASATESAASATESADSRVIAPGKKNYNGAYSAYSGVHDLVCCVRPSQTHSYLYIDDRCMFATRYSVAQSSFPIALHLLAPSDDIEKRSPAVPPAYSHHHRLTSDRAR